MSDARKYLEISGRFQMVRGSLASPVIAYETWGKLNAQASNAVLIFTGISPSAHAASSQDNPSTGWWEDMIGPGLPIDTLKYFVICVNSLGSCLGSTGPNSENPETGRKYRLDFPVLHLEDIARSGSRVVTSLGVKIVRGCRRFSGWDDCAHIRFVVSRSIETSGVNFLGCKEPAVFDCASFIAA